MKVFVLIVLLGMLAGCSSFSGSINTVSTVIPKGAVVKYSQNKGSEDRFSNLYPTSNPQYPDTCEQDCYAPNKFIECLSPKSAPMENCLFTQTQIKPNLDTGFKVKWLGHASFVIETPDGQTLLIDPVFEQFDWPVNWAFRWSYGYDRKPPETMSKSQLSAVDGVLYSHIHYDHFNKDDIRSIGTKAKYFTPLGFAEHFENHGYDITQMAWYAKQTLNDITIHFVPAHHFSSRILVPYIYEDDDKTLWGGWIVEYQGKKLFYAGDTGYSKHFKDIQAKYGDIDVCLMPIASYYSQDNPDWYRYVHTTPEDSINAAADLNCGVMIPWGYGNASWKMGDHTSHSALFRLLNMYEQLKAKTPLYILNEGEGVKF